MKRRLLAILAGLSTAAFAAICGLWIWSDPCPETPRHILGGPDLNIRASRGYIIYTGPPKRWNKWTIYVVQTSTSTTSMLWGPSIILIPCWKIAMSCLPLPLVWAIWFRKRPVEDATPHCAVCGYDLRATPDRCPECGTAVQKNSSVIN